MCRNHWVIAAFGVIEAKLLEPEGAQGPVLPGVPLLEERCVQLSPHFQQDTCGGREGWP